MVTPILAEFAQQLLDGETAADDPPTEQTAAALRVLEKLRRSISTYAGVAGFRSLLGRALGLAKADVPWLKAAQVNAEGVLVGLGGGGPPLAPNEVTKGEVLLIANLIGLMVAFLGEDLTLNLVREVWPTVSEFAKDEKE